MPWSNQGGGGGKKGPGNGGGPWGGPGGGGGGSKEPPDLDEILRRGQDSMKRVMGRGGGSGGGGGGFDGGVPKSFVFLLGLMALLGAAYYGFYFRVNPDEQGIVLRFGKFDHWEPAGPHFRWPYPIEEVITPKVTSQRRMEIGTAGGHSVPGSADSGLMLTGDGSVVDVRFVVLWRISPDTNPKTGKTGVEQFLFNIAQPETTVREVAESTMREVVGKSTLQPLLTGGRVKTEEDVKKLMQSILDTYGAGINVDQVQLMESDAPAQVNAAFRDVAAAAQDKKRLILEAQTYADQKIPQANGDANRIVAAAEGFRDQQIAEATGQAARFLKVYEEYKKAPEVTRQRLFLEMQEKVLSGADKIILDQKGGNSVVPYLPLDQLQKHKTEGGQP